MFVWDEFSRRKVSGSRVQSLWKCVVADANGMYERSDYYFDMLGKQV